MKWLKQIRDNSMALSESAWLAFFGSIPFIIDLQGKFSDFMMQADNPDNFLWKLAISHGNPAIAVALVALCCMSLRRYNKNQLVNKLNVYHEYPYVWYLYCAKILGFGNCNLVNTPIWLQVKLVMNHTFDKYPLDEADYPKCENEIIHVKSLGKGLGTGEVNLILEDTYPIIDCQIPSSERRNHTIIVSRDNKSHARYYSPRFIEEIIDVVGKLPDGTVLNVFATTNPKNMMHITNGAFTKANRGSVSHLYVFRQNAEKNRTFLPKGKKIF